MKHQSAGGTAYVKCIITGTSTLVSGTVSVTGTTYTARTFDITTDLIAGTSISITLNQSNIGELGYIKNVTVCASEGLLTNTVITD